jgi:hypothetical protein
MTWTQELRRHILACTGKQFRRSDRSLNDLLFLGRMFRTDWFRSHIQVRDGRILTLEPSNMPARRVRVIERKGLEHRRDFVQDVTADEAPNKGGIAPALLLLHSSCACRSAAARLSVRHPPVSLLVVRKA